MPNIMPERTLLVSTVKVTSGTLEVVSPVEVVSTFEMKSVFLPTLRKAVWPFIMFTLGFDSTLMSPCVWSARNSELKSPPVRVMLKLANPVRASVNLVVPMLACPPPSHSPLRKVQSTPYWSLSVSCTSMMRASTKTCLFIIFFSLRM